MIGLVYLLMPLVFMVLGLLAMSTHTVLGWILGVAFTCIAANEWRAYWIYRRQNR
jgi:uncharacterized membrane protein